jgi:hypothetical protein
MKLENFRRYLLRSKNEAALLIPVKVAPHVKRGGMVRMPVSTFSRQWRQKVAGKGAVAGLASN